MRHKFYEEFISVLMDFIAKEEFFINTDFFGENKLIYDYKTSGFKFKKTYKAKLSTSDVYKIIKLYIEEKIANEQNEIFGIEIDSFDNFDYRLCFNKEQFEKYCLLVSRFRAFLLDEPILPSDIPIIGSYFKLSYGFKKSEVTKNFLVDILKRLHSSRYDFYNWCIYVPLCSESSYLKEVEKFESEGYVTIKFVGNDMKLNFTKKFLDAFKLSFFYEFDPSVKRCN